jgi:hypothetical protein
MVLARMITRMIHTNTRAGIAMVSSVTGVRVSVRPTTQREEAWWMADG